MLPFAGGRFILRANMPIHSPRQHVARLESRTGLWTNKLFGRPLEDSPVRGLKLEVESK
jgi:hypothetical protein